MTTSETERIELAGQGRPTGRSLALLATGLAAVALGARFAGAVLVNAPGVLSGVPTALLGTGVTALAGYAAIALGVTRDDPVAGTGLLFVGVFGLLGTFVGAVTTPAAVAVVGGTAAVAVAVHEDFSPGTGVVTALLLAALGVSLTGGLVATSLRPAGSTLALLAIAATPAFATRDLRALLGGAVAFGVVLAAGLTRPFVTGAITLVGGGVVGTSLPVVALAVAGAVTTASAAIRTRRFALLAGVCLLGFAGVPAALARAVPFALGIATLLTLEVRR